MKTLLEVESTIKAPADKTARVQIAQVLHLVETVGIEPTSENTSERISPSAAGYLCFAPRPPNRRTTETLARKSLTMPGGHARFSCMSTPGPFPAGEERPTRGAELSSECEIVIRFSV